MGRLTGCAVPSPRVPGRGGVGQREIPAALPQVVEAAPRASLPRASAAHGPAETREPSPPALGRVSTDRAMSAKPAIGRSDRSIAIPARGVGIAGAAVDPRLRRGRGSISPGRPSSASTPTWAARRPGRPAGDAPGGAPMPRQPPGLLGGGVARPDRAGPPRSPRWPVPWSTRRASGRGGPACAIRWRPTVLLRTRSPPRPAPLVEPGAQVDAVPEGGRPSAPPWRSCGPARSGRRHAAGCGAPSLFRSPGREPRSGPCA
jgi:hypothetical protein